MTRLFILLLLLCSGSHAVTVNYRSIGTTGTLYSTGQATIQGTTVTFSSATTLPTTIGRGDKITMGSEVRYILDRISDREVTLQTPASTMTGVAYTISRAFTSPQAWNAAQGKRLLSDDRCEIGIVYDITTFNGLLEIHEPGEDVQSDPTHYMMLTVAPSARHTGRAGTGVALTRTGSNGPVIRVTRPYTRIEWLEVTNWQSSASDWNAGVEVGDATGIMLSNLIVHGGASDGIVVHDAGTHTIRNCLIYDVSGSGIVKTQGAPGITVENVTIYGCGQYGMNIDYEINDVIRNVICMGSGVNDFYDESETPSPVSSPYWQYFSNNMTSDGTAPGAAAIKNAVATDQFVSLTAGNFDFHLKPGSEAAINDMGAFGSVSESQVHYFFDGYTQEIAPGQAVKDYENLGGDGIVENGTYVKYYVKDHLGSTRLVLDGTNGAVIESIVYDAYGAQTVVSRSGSENAREKFTGKEFDQEGEDSEKGVAGIQAYYFGARYYDPEIGFWLSTDPKFEFFNLYAYHTNPISFIDPTGEDFGLSAAIAGAIIAGVIAGATTTATAVAEYQQTGQWNWGDYFKDMLIQTHIGSAVGFVSGGLGAGLSSSFSTAIQAAGGSAFGGATVGGMAAGAISGGVSYSMNYTLQSTFGYQEWGDMNSFTEGLGKSMLIGGAIGLGTGAISHWSTMGADEGTLHHDNIFNDSERGFGSGQRSNNHIRFRFKSGDVATGDITDLGVLGELKKMENVEFINFPSNSPGSTGGGMRITGLNKAAALKYFNQNGYNNVETYNHFTKNCATAVTKSLSRNNWSTHSPTLDALYWMSRQLIRNMHGM